MNTLKKSRILLVDDEVITLRITRKYLSEKGFDVEIAGGTSEAVQLLSKQKFDIVIIDITMPALSGFDLIQMMQSFDIETPVIFLSNNDNRWTIEEAYNRGARRFVSKEREFNNLPNIISEVLQEAMG